MHSLRFFSSSSFLHRYALKHSCKEVVFVPLDLDLKLNRVSCFGHNVTNKLLWRKLYFWYTYFSINLHSLGLLWNRRQMDAKTVIDLFSKWMLKLSRTWPLIFFYIFLITSWIWLRYIFLNQFMYAQHCLFKGMMTLTYDVSFYDRVIIRNFNDVTFLLDPAEHVTRGRIGLS